MPELIFQISNSFGIPVGIRVLDLFVQSIDGTQQPVESSLFDNVVNVPYPLLSERGDTAFQQIVLDVSNSNIAEVLDPSIRELFYSVEIIINPESSSEDQFFVSEASAAVLEARVVLPLQVDISTVSIEYRLPLDVDPIEDVVELRLKLYAENGIPLEFQPSLQFGQLDQILELREDDGVTVTAAPTNPEGMPINSSTSELFFSVSSDELAVINRADSINLQLSMRSDQMLTQGVRVSPGQTLFLGLGVEAKVE